MPKTVRVITARSIMGLGHDKITGRFIVNSGAPRAFKGGDAVIVLYRHSPNDGKPDDPVWRGVARLKGGEPILINVGFSSECLMGGSLGTFPLVRRLF